MDPLLAWFLGQGLGPAAVAKALDLLSQPEEQTQLAKAVARSVNERVSWRRVRRWLRPDDAWRDLVEQSSAGAERLITNLQAILWPTTRGRPRTYQARRALAERLVGETGARLLSNLDPSLAVAVADFRARRAVGELGVRLGLPAGDVKARLNYLGRRSVDRNIRRLEALGVSGDVARSTAATLSVPLPTVVANDELTVLVGELGTGKSTEAERHHLAAIEEARSDPTARLPVLVTAREVAGSLLSEIQRLWGDVSDLPERGVHLIVDGLEEVGATRANALVVEVRSIMRELKKSRVLLARRSLDVSADEGATLHVPPLDQEQAIEIVAAVAGRALGREEDNWPPSVRDAVRRPLFAIGAGLSIRENQRPTSPADLIDAMARRATADVDWSAAVDLLGRAAAMSVDVGHGPIRLNEVANSVADERVIKATNLVRLDPHNRTVTWEVVLLAEWFAAQHVLRHPSLVTELAVEHGRLDRWRYVLSLATELAGSEALSRILDPVARRSPALAGWLLSRERKVAGEPLPPEPSASQWGVRLRMAAEAFAEGLGPLVDLMTPFLGGQVLPIGIGVRNEYASYAWHIADPAGPPIRPFPPSPNPLVNLEGWRGGAHCRLDGRPVWPWIEIFERLRDELARALEDGRLLCGPVPIAMEADWKLARDLIGRGGVSANAIAIDEIASIVEAHPDWSDESRLQHGGDPARLGDARLALARLQSMGVTEVRDVWPGPDRLEPWISWIPHRWTPERLRMRAELVVRAALEAYRETVDAWLPRFGGYLRLTAAWPVRFVGHLVPGDPTSGVESPPAFIWQLEGPVDELGVELTVVRDPHETEGLLDRRPLSLTGGFGELPGLFGPMPASDLTVDLLWNDLAEWGWVRGTPRRHY